MKKISVILTALFFTSCVQNEAKQEAIKKDDAKIEIEQADRNAKNNTGTPNDVSRLPDIEIPKDSLISVEILNKKSKNIFKKYGLEFSGNCYGCDLAELKINDQKISIYNTCDNKIHLEIAITKVASTKNEIIIETGTGKFIFLKTEDLPIYKLKIIDKKFKNENLRIGTYFTLKKIINKFEVHDCGDFQG
ncbi:MAG: hypothetical protein ABIN01_25655 [Ferruginibacter sp.]